MSGMDLQRKWRVSRVFLLGLLTVAQFTFQVLPLGAAQANSPTQTSAGLAKGALVIQGGGEILPEIWDRFITLAGDLKPILFSFPLPTIQ
jgi:hypothetical protein